MIFSLGFIWTLFTRNPDMLRHQWMHGTLAMLIFLSWQFVVRLKSPSLAIGFFVFSYAGVRTFITTVLYENWVKQDSSYSFALFIMVSMTALLMHKKTVDRFMDALGVICLGTSLLMLTLHIWNAPFYCYAWQNNRSADASMIAVLYPFLAFRPGFLQGLSKNVWYARFLVAVPIITIALAGSSTAIAALCVCAASYTWFYRRHPMMLLAGVMIAMGALVGLLFLHKDFFYDNGRKTTWIEMSLFWVKNCTHPWFGTGSGSFFDIGPNVQAQLNTHGDAFFAWMHNEFLQVTFEQGFRGLLALILVGVCALRRAYSRPWLFSALCTYGFVMTTQFPFRYFAPAMIGAIILRETCETRTT